MNEGNLASLVLGIVSGFYTIVFVLCLSDVVYLSKEMNKIKVELADIRKIHFNQSIIFNRSSPSSLVISDRDFFVENSQRTITGKFCLSYGEQRQVLDYINFLCNMAILIFGTYSIYVHGLGTHHGLSYRFIFFILKIITVVLSIWLNLHFKKGLPSDIFLYVWIDLNCVASIVRSLQQSL